MTRDATGTPVGTQVIAHRGASRLERENTVAAFRRAALLGAPGVELDVRRAADGVLVVHHDAHLADGRAIVGVAAAHLPPHVPTLDAALAACDGMWVNVEIKNDRDEPDFDPSDDVADAVVDLLARRGDPPGRWLISAFRLETADRVHVRWPDLPTAWLTGAVEPGAVETVAERGHVALHPWEGGVDQALVRRCHDAGLRINVWTCDDPERMRQLASWGVDGICTNVPDVALRALGRA